MPRRRPGALRAAERRTPGWLSEPGRIHRLSLATSAAIRRVECESDLYEIFPGVTAAALARCCSFFHLPGRTLYPGLAGSPLPRLLAGRRDPCPGRAGRHPGRACTTAAGRAGAPHRPDRRAVAAPDPARSARARPSVATRGVVADASVRRGRRSPTAAAVGPAAESASSRFPGSAGSRVTERGHSLTDVMQLVSRTRILIPGRALVTLLVAVCWLALAAAAGRSRRRPRHVVPGRADHRQGGCARRPPGRGGRRTRPSLRRPAHPALRRLCTGLLRPFRAELGR